MVLVDTGLLPAPQGKLQRGTVSVDATCVQRAGRQLGPQAHMRVPLRCAAVDVCFSEQEGGVQAPCSACPPVLHVCTCMCRSPPAGCLPPCMHACFHACLQAFVLDVSDDASPLFHNSSINSKGICMYLHAHARVYDLGGDTRLAPAGCVRTHVPS